MSDMTHQERFLRHTQLKLRSFYSRLTYSPWKPVILFCGDQRFAPYKQQDKKLFLARTLEETSMTLPHAFELVLDDFQEIPFPDGGVDTLICYWNKQFPSTTVLHEFHRILSPQGKMILTVNNRHSLYYSLQSWRQSDHLWAIESALSLYDFIILKGFSHSFYPPGYSKRFIAQALRSERFLKRYFGRWSNQYSFICVKNTEHYQPLPSYLRLSQQIPISSLLEPS